LHRTGTEIAYTQNFRIYVANPVEGEIVTD
ncbi:unnamed protein product, partial [marine sediment metagenome]